MDKYIGMFLGPRKIVSLELLEQKTSIGNEIYSVTFEGDEKSDITKSALLAGVSSELSDWTSLQKKKMTPMVTGIIDVLSEYDLQVYELDMILKLVSTSLTENFNHALSYRWYGDSKKFIPGTDPVSHFTLLEADKILRSIPLNQEEEKKDDSAK